MEEIEVRINGHIDKSWSDSLGLAINPQRHGQTVLTGLVRDQAALVGLLNRLSGLGLQLLSVRSESRNGPVTRRSRDVTGDRKKKTRTSK